MAERQQGGEVRHRPSFVTRRLARSRYLVFTLVVAVTVLLGARALEVEFDFSVDAVYAFDDPALRFYHEVVVPQFGASDNVLVALVSAEQVYSQAALQALVALHEALADIAGVGRVQSLANASIPGERDGVFGMLRVFGDERVPSDPVNLARLVNSSSLLSGQLVSADRTTTAVYLQLDDGIRNQAQRAPPVRQAQEVIARLQAEHPQVAIRLTGIPVISESITQLLMQDQLAFIPGVLAVMGVLLFVAFRSGRGVVLPFMATGAATVWTLGVMRFEGHSINVTNNAIITLLLVIGVSDAIHLLSRFEEEVRRQRLAGITVGKLKTVAVVTQHLGVACLLTSITTAVGFGSLMAAKLKIIAEFGQDAAIGVVLAYLATIGLIPALLAILPIPRPRRSDPRGRDLSDRLLSHLARFALEHRWLVIGLSLAATAVSLDGARRIRPHDRILAELPAAHPVRSTLEFATQRFGGLIPFDIVIETPAGRADDADVLAALLRIQDFLRPMNRVRTYSVLDLLDGMDTALSGPDAPEPRWSQGKVAQYLLLLEMNAEGRDHLSALLSSRRNLVRIACFGDDIGTGRVMELEQALRAHVAGFLPADVMLHVTGPLIVTSRALAFVVRDMATSLALALVIILAIMGLLFRSWRIGMLALVPNAIPVLLALGVMGYAGITLRPGTAVIFSMALGIAVDNSIHFLSRYREESRRLNDNVAAVAAAVQGTGRPILYTTIMLSAGLGVLLASSFVALQHLAILGATTFISAMVVDLLLLPVLLAWLDPGKSSH